MSSLLAPLIESKFVPDRLLRIGIRHLLAQRLREEVAHDSREQQHRLDSFVAAMDASPIAFQTDTANAQHYEVPTEFFQQCLGPQLKYSSGWWDPGTATLGDAERRMLELTCERAQLADGQSILELGCGWGSLSLWMARHYPRAQITAVSNSRTQKLYLDARIAALGLTNLRIETADMNHFAARPAAYDRVVSVEMFEHMRNWRALLGRIHGWLRPDGRLFIHIFTHRCAPYPFVDRGPSDWMGRHFFSGGMMPSADLLPRVADRFAVESQWHVSGLHYARTAEAWLANFDAGPEIITPILARTYGKDEVQRWRWRWRVFFLACAELWAYRGGEEWAVTHYRLAPALPGRS